MSMKRIACALLLLLLNVPSAFSRQADSTARSFHVFPQIADGRFTTGGGFAFSLYAVSASTVSNTCDYQLYGMNTDRLPDLPGMTKDGTSGSFTLPGFSDSFRIQSLGQSLLATGYATLSCSGPVTAQILYISFGSSGQTLAMATVFSSQPGTFLQFPIVRIFGSRLAVAIANNGTGQARCDLNLADPSRNSVGIRTLTIAPRSNSPSFVDENIPIPPGFTTGTLGLFCDRQVSTIGLFFDGTAFTTVPATVLLQ